MLVNVISKRQPLKGQSYLQKFKPRIFLQQQYQVSKHFLYSVKLTWQTLPSQHYLINNYLLSFEQSPCQGQSHDKKEVLLYSRCLIFPLWWTNFHLRYWEWMRGAQSYLLNKFHFYRNKVNSLWKICQLKLYTSNITME